MSGIRDVPPAPSSNALILLVLVGLPGSGKSTLAHALQVELGWVRASQDDAPRGRRGECEDAVRVGLRMGRNVVVDRVGFDRAQRAYFLKLAKESEFEGRVTCWCLVLEAPYEVLKHRLLLRPSHPTLTDSTLALRVLSQMSRLFAPPIHARPEGFRRVLYIGVERQPDGGVWDVETLRLLLKDIGEKGCDDRVVERYDNGGMESWRGRDGIGGGRHSDPGRGGGRGRGRGRGGWVTTGER